MSPIHRYDVRASDLDRERAVEFLKAHYADGRLRDDELAWRTDSAYRAIGLAQLDHLTADLPALAPAPRRRRRLSLVTAAWLLALLVVLLVVVPPEAWVVMLVLLIPLGMVAFIVVAPLAIPVLVIVGIVHLIARATRPRPPRHVGWR